MPTTPKGLATVAFLKTRLDEGHDHLGLLEPLIFDALSRIQRGDFIAAEISAIVLERTGVAVPSGTVHTLLGRCARRQLLRREGGRFFRTNRPIPGAAFDERRATFEQEQRLLGQDLEDFATGAGCEFGSAENALAALATFVSDNKVPLLLEEDIPESPLDRSSLDRKQTRTIARFITDRCLPSESLRGRLASLVEGILIEDALLLRDFPASNQKFENLMVFLDTAILLAAIGLTGVANAVAAKEGLSLVRDAGGRTLAFTRTIDEMRRILSVYEVKLQTTEGRMSLLPTALTHYILSTRQTPSDIRMISSTIEQRLSKIGVQIREIPPHKAEYTFDEKKLAESLVSHDHPNVDAPRVRHDVDCVAAVLTIRGNHRATNVERSGAIFSTTSGSVVSAIQKWYASEETNVNSAPPIVHHWALTTIAWLKKPASAPNLKLHELAAICVAAMRPSRQTWHKLIETLRKLRQDGLITDDETAAVVASDLTEPLLTSLDDEVEPDADSILDAIDRVRDTYRQEARREVENIATDALDRARQTREAADAAIRAANRDAVLAQELANDAISRRNSVIDAVTAKIDQQAGRAATFIYWTLAVICAISMALAIPGVFESIGPLGKWIARGILIAAGCWYTFSGIKDRSLPDVRLRLKHLIAEYRMRQWFPVEQCQHVGDVLHLSHPQPKAALEATDNSEGGPPHE